MLTCENISIRKLNKDDKVLYQALYADQRLMTFIGDVLDAESAAKYYHLTLKYMAMTPPFMILYVICEKKSDESIGVIGLRWNQKQPDAVEIGVIIKFDKQRRGYAHKAKELVMYHAFKQLGINTIIAQCDEANTAANNANKKLGFRRVDRFIDEQRQVPIIKWQMNKEDLI